MNLTEEQILSLAPDDSSRKSGKELANPSKWSNTGANTQALWGECQGSGKNPYRTQVDLSNIAFKCSCPSRKFPCKHGLGVLLLYSRQSQLFPAKESPSWVTEWLSKREEKAEKKQEKPDKPVDAEAQAKRQQQRLKKIEGGIDELQLVLKDIVRNGILNMPEKGPALFNNLTKRMVDSQAPGLAAMTRNLAGMNYFEENWQSRFLDQVSRMYLATTAFRKSGSQSEMVRAELKNSIGLSPNPEELKQTEEVKDNWFILGKQTEQQDQLFVQSNWLLGASTGKYALVLQFYVKAQLPELNLTPGTFMEAELVFYPGLCNYRAILKNTGKTSLEGESKGFETWEEVSRFEKEQFISSPFITEFPVFINQVCLASTGTDWFLNDLERRSVRLHMAMPVLYKLLALSGGKSFSAALIGQEGVYKPLGIILDNQYFDLCM